MTASRVTQEKQITTSPEVYGGIRHVRNEKSRVNAGSRARANGI